MPKTTLSELAELTGFSKATISRVLNEKADDFRISADTQQLIRSTYALINGSNEGIEGTAQQLRNGNDQNLGLIVPSISNPFFANLAAAIIAEAQEYGFSIMIFDTQENEALELKTLHDALKRSLDGLIIVPVNNSPSPFEIMQKYMPVMLVDRYFKKSELPYIATNNYEGGYMAMKQLINAGHKSILIIEGPETSITTKERERGAKAAIRKLGKECNVFFRGNEFSVHNGYLQTKLSRILKPKPTAVFAMSSTIQLGCMKALRELNLNIPDDISVISYDNPSYLDYLNPPASRIAQPIISIGKTAVKIMIESILHKKPITTQILMSPKLISRCSIKTFPVT